MDIIYALCFLISIVFFIQIVMALLTYIGKMFKIKSLKVIYKNDLYFKKAMYLIIFFGIFVFGAILFNMPSLNLLTLPSVILTNQYLKKYYQNIIMADETYIYNGVSTLPFSSIEEVSIEEGRNLEKKYGVPFVGLERYKNGKYIIFKLASGHNILLKDYDEEYLTHMQKYFNITSV